MGMYCPLSYPLWKDSDWKEDSAIRSGITESRLRSVENPERGWVLVRDDPQEPMLITMGHGKGRALASEPFRRIQSAWKEAAKFLGRAHRLVIIGYSIPADDMEARLLLRYAIWQHCQQFGCPPTVKVIDPSRKAIGRIKRTLATEVEEIAAAFDPSDEGQWT